MPITFGMKGSSYVCPQITGGVENAVPLHVDIVTDHYLPMPSSNIIGLNINFNT
jgi:hypothetical protein